MTLFDTTFGVPTVFDLMAHYTDLQIPCPDCGTPLVGARIGITGDHPHGTIGVACLPCDVAWEVGP